MFEQPDSPSTSQTKQQILYATLGYRPSPPVDAPLPATITFTVCRVCLPVIARMHPLLRPCLQGEIHTILSAEPDCEERVKRLETDLEVFKRACFTAESDKRLLNEEITSLRERLDAQKCNSETRIVCLIDGNGTIFSAELMAKGQDGGRLAAKQLGESVRFHLTSAQSCHLWTYIFFNKQALLDMFAAVGGEYIEARDRFEEFVSGFNQSSEWFVMADIGNGEGAADAKIKAHLDFHARSQDTYKIVFGGCHDNSYMHHLHSLQLTSVYREKLVLLPGYTEMASEISKLQLPSLVIPGLFIPDKITVANLSRHSSISGQSGTANGNSVKFGSPPGLPLHVTPSPNAGQMLASPSGSVTPPPPPPYPQQVDTISSVNSDVVQIRPEDGRAAILSPSHSTTPERQPRIILGHASGPVSYRPSTVPWAHNKLHHVLDHHIESSSSDMKGAGKQKRINHSIPLSQNDPPPCTLFYLAANGCKHGPDCRFGHDYVLDDEDYELLRLNAKKVPCPALNRGDTCIFGNDCCYGHTCPYLGRCHYFKQSKCKFSGGEVAIAMAELAELLKSLNISKDPEMAPPGDQLRLDIIWDNMLKQLKGAPPDCSCSSEVANRVVDLSSATVEKNIDSELISRVTQLEEELHVWKQARRGLQDTLVKNNVCSVDQFEAFFVGFSQASSRFLLVDAGHGKEAADAKIRIRANIYALSSD
ncbi:hypothetical protein EW145_g5107 [Phellinidium pouzarii]|uniref:C3H1-type domain-containing protein n=1 Tax=Phellinidium pouzarii TaxID=167371 RepID=A0A4S4L317_9AGAM|nr:hypothetical protein EW145_g5107 [Phellinidium pouzarii]